MHPADIRASIKKAASSQAEIASALKVSEPAVSLVINNKLHSQRIAKYISSLINKPVGKLWPGAYSEEAA